MTDIVLSAYDVHAGGSETVSPVSEVVRVAVTGQNRQIDLSLPLDVPVAVLVPEIVRMFDDGAGSQERPKELVWVLIRAESGVTLQPDCTLREAGVARDDVLNLRGRGTHAAPTLYDDVVDAAARLNRSGHPGWDPAAARTLAYLALGLSAATWVHLVVLDASSPRRAALLGLTAFAALALFVVAVVLPRSGGAPRDGAALAWAAIPIAAAGGWVALSPHGSLALAGGALALALLSAAGYHLVGAGLAGFTVSATFFACAAAVLGVHAAGAPGCVSAVGLAVGAIAATAAVPGLTARCDYAGPDEPSDDVEQFDTRAGRARSLRGGLYAGFAAGACVGGTAASWLAPAPAWPTWTFGVVCAAALALPRPTAHTALVRAAAGLPAAVLFITVVLHGVRGDHLLPVLSASTLLAGAILLAAVTARATPSHPGRWALHSLASYLAWALVVPSAAWALAAHWGLG
ncbi:type VII secretion integral membrane protein EccD [Mycobacterium sp. djl-10]|nr:type VII secretion integral membrane protein EccD [Mycobacterium sp. djl-10]